MDVQRVFFRKLSIDEGIEPPSETENPQENQSFLPEQENYSQESEKRTDLDFATQQAIIQCYRDRLHPKVLDENDASYPSSTPLSEINEVIDLKFEQDNTPLSCNENEVFASENPSNALSEEAVQITQPRRKKKKKYKWNKAKLDALHKLHDQYCKTHPSKYKGISEKGWISLTDDMRKAFPEDKFSVSCCKFICAKYLFKKNKKASESYDEKSRSDESFQIKQSNSTVKWEKKRLDALQNLHSIYCNTHPGRHKGTITMEGWKLLTEDMKKEFPKYTFTLAGCRNACRKFLSKKKTKESDKEKNQDQKKNSCKQTKPSTYSRKKWNKKLQRKLCKLHSRYSKSHHGMFKDSMTEEGWKRLTEDMKKSFPDHTFSRDTCRQAFYNSKKKSQSKTTENEKEKPSDESSFISSTWSKKQLRKLRKLHSQYCNKDTYKSTVGINTEGWKRLTEDMKKSFPGSSFSLESCRKVFFEIQKNSTSAPVSNTPGIKWDKDCLEMLEKLHDQYSKSHPGIQKKSIKLEGWKLLADDMRKAFPSFSFTIQGCKRAYSSIAKDTRLSLQEDSESTEIHSQNETILPTFDSTQDTASPFSSLSPLEDPLFFTNLNIEVESWIEDLLSESQEFTLELPSPTNEILQEQNPSSVIPHQDEYTTSPISPLSIIDENFLHQILHAKIAPNIPIDDTHETQGNNKEEKPPSVTPHQDEYTTSPTPPLSIIDENFLHQILHAKIVPNIPIDDTHETQGNNKEEKPPSEENPKKKPLIWTESHFNKLIELHDEFQNSKKSKWKLIKRGMKQAFPKDSFTLSSCSKAFNRFNSKKKNRKHPQGILIWQREHINKLQELHALYRISHKRKRGISSEGWNLLIQDMKKAFPLYNFTIDSCKIAYQRHIES